MGGSHDEGPSRQEISPAWSRRPGGAEPDRVARRRNHARERDNLIGPRKPDHGEIRRPGFGPPPGGIAGIETQAAATDPRSLTSEPEELNVQVREMISTHPDVKGDTADALLKCIEECYACAQTCTSCADACLAEEKVSNLRQCIRLNLDCADACLAAGAMGSRRTGSNEPVLAAALRLCAEACNRCGEECEKHGEMHEHCRICAESCRRCARSCEEALSQVQ